MVGGATRMPHIQRAVGEFFQQEPLNNLDPDKVVALGAAIQANVLAGNRAEDDDWLLLDVIPLSLGLETMGGLVEKIIPRNSTIPVASAQEFTTFKDGQTAMSFHVVQGERELVGRLPLARALRAARHSADGGGRGAHPRHLPGRRRRPARRSRRARMSSGVEASVTVKPSYGLSDDEIAGMLRESFDHAPTTCDARALREQQVEARRAASKRPRRRCARTAICLTPEERGDDRGGGAQAALGCREGSDTRALKAAIEALNAGTAEFAARRMDQASQARIGGPQSR